MTKPQAFEKALDIIQAYFETQDPMVEVQKRDEFYELLDEYSDQIARLKRKEQKEQI